MAPKVVIRREERGPALKLLLSVISKAGDSSTFISDPIVIDGLAAVRLSLANALTMRLTMSVKEVEPTKSCIQLSIKNDDINTQWICPNNWSEYKEVCQIPCANTIEPDAKQNEYSKFYTYVLELNMSAQIVIPSNETLYEDNRYCDFTLFSPDGAVQVHKLMVDNHSEVLRPYLRAQGKASCRIDAVSLRTLQHFKDYVYLGKLPIVGLPELLLFAIHGKMGKLRDDCIRRLATVVTGNDVDNLIDFAIKNNIPELVQAMLSFTSASAVQEAHQMRKNKIKFCTVNFTHLALE